MLGIHGWTRGTTGRSTLIPIVVTIIGARSSRQRPTGASYRLI